MSISDKGLSHCKLSGKELRRTAGISRQVEGSDEWASMLILEDRRGHGGVQIKDVRRQMGEST